MTVGVLPHVAFEHWCHACWFLDWPSDLVIFQCNLVIFCKVCVWRKSAVLLLTFQPFSIREQLITWMVVWRFAPTEHTSVSNLSFQSFSLPRYCCCNIGHGGIFISLQECCWRNNQINVRLIGLKHSVCGVVFNSWKEPDDCWYDIILTNLQMIQKFLGYKVND